MIRKIKDLSGGLKERAIDNHHRYQFIHHRPDNFEELELHSAFYWVNSPEGYMFWQHVSYSESIDEVELIKLLLKQK